MVIETVRSGKFNLNLVGLRLALQAWRGEETEQELYWCPSVSSEKNRNLGLRLEQDKFRLTSVCYRGLLRTNVMTEEK